MSPLPGIIKFYRKKKPKNKERHQKQNACNDTVSNDRIFNEGRKINVIGRVEEEGEKEEEEEDKG